MSDDLIERLSESCYLAFEDGTNDFSAAQEAIDRIKQLERERDEAQINHAAWKLEAEAIQAELAKAVETLREMHKKSMWLRGEQSYREFARYVEKITRAMLAELEGK